MKRGSLTLRLSIMFVVSVVVVLVVAGTAFNELSRHHFRALDKQALVEKLEATRLILNNAESAEDPSGIQLQLRALLSAHPDLSALVLASDGSVIFSAPPDLELPSLDGGRLRDDVWEWEHGHHLYRGLTAKVVQTASGQTFTVWLILDVTTHMHFFALLQWWFGVVLLGSAALSALLGWLVAKSGLKPVAQVTQVAASMSAGSLKNRIPLEPVPDELRELIVAFNSMLARLEESFIRLSNFSADIAHELRTPLSNLRTHTEVVLAKKRAPDAYEENLFSNLEELNRLSTIIDGMLFLAKSDNGLVLPNASPFELSEAVNKLFGYYELLADDNNVKLVLEGSGEVVADAVMVDRIVSNLLSNALRYTPSQGIIRVTIRNRADNVQLSLENPGPSIPPEHLDRIFDRFYRVDPARREGSANAGLGLAIARSLMHAHGGQISCRSSDNVTTFTLVFPRHDFAH
ncbi:heavy metal sensor histidine kinase [Pseudomonas alliivorans]|uniref:heavy metal sensor histidine kinase n=1 Tax=Pseudomonas cannabina TaxID=86840 RepID=UPI001EE45187|nr:heavy metal sensor histidine kinase [Pseudomonas cannabina]MEE4964433.1 heavy metal sensor histidine kinase [Pseudomonas alliivorans]MEE4974586.1 heavy metal sensor histidine kinase [Pseudomonas alliivorans]MEE4979735.1 heavy metal sensor histidine kinase [Pseudomonas alliivorans]MEE4984882.1 heavy metal sensor histidine kinase [Pseudomonas alliivorans]MEE5004649.1 heavy metal sensor histidine kinase [Pseudomonas alliivorans]